MSKKHPVVVITGSSGAGTSTVKKALEAIFYRQKINPVVVEGDSLRVLSRSERPQMWTSSPLPIRAGKAPSSATGRRGEARRQLSG